MLIKSIFIILNELIAKKLIIKTCKGKTFLAHLYSKIMLSLGIKSQRGNLLIAHSFIIDSIIDTNKINKLIKMFQHAAKPLTINALLPLPKYFKKKIEVYNNNIRKSYLPKQIGVPYILNKKSQINIKTGKIIHLITDDHEWSITPGKSFGKNYLSLYEAEVQLIKKGYIINEISNSLSIPWVHLIDIGAYLLLEAASKEYPHTWGEIKKKFEKFMIDTIRSGNDLGVHIHPDKSHLAIERIEKDKIFIKSFPSWGEMVMGGKVDDIYSKQGLLLRGKKLVEEFGKMADSNFEAVFFRAGKYSIGNTVEQTADSMSILSNAGLKIMSDALLCDGMTSSLSRNTKETVYYCKHGMPWLTEDHPNEKTLIQALPFRSKYFPVYSVLASSKIYAKNKSILPSIIEELKEGNRLAVSIDHDIDFGYNLVKQSWDNLDADKGDWCLLTNYLLALSETEEFAFVNSRDFYKIIKKN